jgi:hypothetical protein
VPTKVVINSRCGGFGVSAKVCARLFELGVPTMPPLAIPPEGLSLYENEESDKAAHGPFDLHISSDEYRAHPLLVQVVEELGPYAASGKYAWLKVVEIPDGVEWGIMHDSDGSDFVEEKHRVWA